MKREMITHFQELVEKSGDSLLEYYRFRNGVLELNLEVDQIDALATIVVPTNVVRASGGDQLQGIERRTCFLELLPLDKELLSEHNIYIPNPDFGRMMQEVRKGLFLAYGSRKQDVRWLLSLVGSSRLLSCTVTRIEAIKWNVDYS